MLSQEVAACDKRVEAWLQQQSVVTARQPAQTQAPLNSARDLPEEVVALEVTSVSLTCNLLFVKNSID